MNRRQFLSGSGAAAAATALASGPGLAAPDAKAGAKVIRSATTMALRVNGRAHQVTVEPRTTLLEVLRTQLHLTGAKPVSADGTSGASTVLVEGKPMSASTILALQARGKDIRTVESLGGAKLDAVPRAFVNHDAQQCGFCTPGFVVAVRAFLNQHPAASEEEIRHGLNGNICRCGTYANIIHAALAAVKGEGG
jgi:xanthine dehydrogenase YagT iron-sulfur-binding subunit